MNQMVNYFQDAARGAWEKELTIEGKIKKNMIVD